MTKARQAINVDELPNAYLHLEALMQNSILKHLDIGKKCLTHKRLRLNFS